MVLAFDILAFDQSSFVMNASAQGVMLGFYVSAQQVDLYFARAQRKQLGLCEECGGVFNPKTCTEKACPLRKVSEYSISEKDESR